MRHRLFFILCIVIIIGCFYSSCSKTEQPKSAAAGPDWTRWRGPNADGTYPETDWNPSVINQELKPLWTFTPGKGYSSVVTKGDLLYTLGYDKGQDTVFCLNDRDGSVVWSYSYDCKPGEYSGPKATPFIDGDSLYSLSQEGHVFCFNAQNGNIIWQKHLNDLGAQAPTWGFAGSPVIQGDVLLLNACESGVALDKQTGEVIWQSKASATGYSTPVLYEQGGIRYIALFGQRAVYGVEFETGKVAWSLPWQTSYDVNAADPIIFDNKVFISTNYRRGCALADIQTAPPQFLWKSDLFSSHFSSFVYNRGYIYGNDGAASGAAGGFGFFRCIDAQTGEDMWFESAGLGSLIMVGEKLILLDDQGNLKVAEATPDEYREIAAGVLPRGLYWTPPVFCKGRLYIRNNARGELYKFDLQ
ncbi:MAG: PQQ-binding-like beta-propeller repeat protein [Spirochaetales bacterium]|nr:PQQ-binding-like beta-propeller repeat protein [Spirochaetales bacterium]